MKVDGKCTAEPSAMHLVRNKITFTGKQCLFFYCVEVVRKDYCSGHSGEVHESMK